MQDAISILLIMIPALPLAAAALTALLGPRLLRGQSHVPVVAGIAGSMVCSLLLLAQVLSQHNSHPGEGFEAVYSLWTWVGIDQAGESASLLDRFQIDVTLRADALTAVMLSMVTLISTLVAVFAVGYMQGDRGYWRFFANIGLFVFSMTMLVSVSNFVLLFVFWEAVGLCSYFLIGFWYQKREAAAAGKKAFLVNRVGDFGFTLAIFLIWISYGTLNFHDAETAQPVFSAVEQSTAEQSTTETPAGLFAKERIESGDYIAGGVGLAICLLLLVGACGKSAQFPLHVWLPDAMEGPTPVSALIHAATMVTAGVYMVVRCTPLFMVSPDAQLVVAGIGGFTALLAGMIALTQFDLKRVLAYSTISQLGYMFLALGTGTLAGITAGMFHLFTHAFFKALLFLGAGSVMHAMDNVIDMRRFGGLRKLMPITHITFLIGCLALAGVPPLAGFWSKDAVIASVHDKVHELSHESAAHGSHPPTTDTKTKAQHTTDVFHLTDAQRAGIYQLLYWVALATAFLTAFYTFRAFFMTFYGPEQIPSQAHGHAHESPPAMWVPLALLSVGAAITGGLFFLVPGWEIANFLMHTPSLAWGAVTETVKPGAFHADVATTSILVALSAIGISAYLYLGGSREIDWLRSLMQMDWLSQLTGGQALARLKNLDGVQVVSKSFRAVGLGWLASLLGYVLLMVLLIVTSPLLIGLFISPYRLSRNKFYFDEIYNVLVIWPTRIAAAICYWIDRHLIDGLVNLCGRVPPAIGSIVRSLQMGLIPLYALLMVLGALALLTVKFLLAAGS